MAKITSFDISCVIDASVLLAVFNSEPHHPEVLSLFDNAAITTFNLAEAVNSVLIKKGGNEDILWNFLGNFVQTHIPLDDDLSIAALKLTKVSKPYGLSLGDRYCLALGQILNVPVYTADKVWKELEEHTGVTVNLIR